MRESRDDFIASKDRFDNTVLHYIALFDVEEFIITILENVEKSQEFSFRLKSISTATNAENRSPMDFFERGKSDSYIVLH